MLKATRRILHWFLFLPSIALATTSQVNVTGVYPPYNTVLAVPTAQMTKVPDPASVGSYSATIWRSSIFSAPSKIDSQVTGVTIIGKNAAGAAVTVKYQTYSHMNVTMMKKYTYSMIYAIGLPTLTPTATSTPTNTLTPTATCNASWTPGCGNQFTATNTTTSTPTATFTPMIQQGKVQMTNGYAYVSSTSWLPGDSVFLTCNGCTGVLTYQHRPGPLQIYSSNPYDTHVVDWQIVRQNVFTNTPTPTYSFTPTATPTVTNTPTLTPTATITNTMTNSPTATITNTVTNTPTNTCTVTPTWTPIF